MLGQLDLRLDHPQRRLGLRLGPVGRPLQQPLLRGHAPDSTRHQRPSAGAPTDDEHHRRGLPPPRGCPCPRSPLICRPRLARRRGGAAGALDARAWELVSPVDKNGGAVGAPGTPAAGVLQAAVQGGALAFGSAASFGEAAGSLPVNQYLATRTPSDWSTENLTPAAAPLGSYPAGAYELFSEDLGSAILNDGEEAFHLAFEGASPDLAHLVFSSEDVLYQSSEGVEQTISSSPGAALAVGPGAVSADGSRVYWTLAGDLYLYEGGASRLVAAAASFQAASREGSIASFLAAGHLYRYDAASEEVTDVTPGGGVAALVGASADGATAYYVTTDGLYRLHGAFAVRLAAAVPAQLPPATGAARVSADGARLFFTSPKPLVFGDTNSAPDAYEWEAPGAGSCQQAGGCFGLLSSGRVGSATFVAASASGDDAFFATATSLLPSDPDSLDLYDARAGGGFPEAPPSTPCLGDDCQGPAPAPEYRSPATTFIQARPNRPIRFAKPRGKHKHKRKHHRRAKHAGHRHGGRR